MPSQHAEPLPEKTRASVKALLDSPLLENSFSGWQMPFPCDLPDGTPNPVCALGECGDPSCPTYRPKRPEVRDSIEDLIVAKCSEQFEYNPLASLDTYVSVGCGLLSQDWIIIEKLRKATAGKMLPAMVRFGDLTAPSKAIACEG